MLESKLIHVIKLTPSELFLVKSLLFIENWATNLQINIGGLTKERVPGQHVKE